MMVLGHRVRNNDSIRAMVAAAVIVESDRTVVAMVPAAVIVKSHRTVVAMMQALTVLIDDLDVAVVAMVGLDDYGLCRRSDSRQSDRNRQSAHDH